MTSCVMVYRTDEINHFLWTSLVYYDVLQQHEEVSKNDRLLMPG